MTTPFLLHFGGFHAAYLIFIVTETSGGFVPGFAFLVCAVAFAINHAFSYRHNLEADRRGTPACPATRKNGLISDSLVLYRSGEPGGGASFDPVVESDQERRQEEEVEQQGDHDDRGQEERHVLEIEGVGEHQHEGPDCQSQGGDGDRGARLVQ